MGSFYADTNISLNQQTLNDSVVFNGRGLHNGLNAIMTVMPADPHTGIEFVRRDVTDVSNVINAKWYNVSDTELSTTVSNSVGTRVSTIEHLMAALYAAGIDNARIVLDAPEVPILDGSSQLFLKAFKQVGTREQSVEKQVIVVDERIALDQGPCSASYQPAFTPWLDISIDFQASVIGKQRLSLTNDGKHFEQVAKARTFGFKQQLTQLQARGLAKGGSLKNAILIDADRVVNKGGLRYEDEFVRHKYLDAVGDLSLAGHVIIGEFKGVKSGHGVHNALLRKLFASRKWHLAPISQVQNQWLSYQRTARFSASCTA